MNTLEVIFGPMFAGKSCELIRKIRILKVLKKQYIVIKPMIDTRDNENMIVSHNLDKEDCLKLENLRDIYTIDKYLSNNIDTIFIDEGQFFSDLKEVVLELVEKYNINVIVAGLLIDSNRKKFGQILDLIPFANKVISLSSQCLICMNGTPGIFSYCNKVADNQILIGASEIYSSVCREHYIKLNTMN